MSPPFFRLLLTMALRPALASCGHHPIAFQPIEVRVDADIPGWAGVLQRAPENAAGTWAFAPATGQQDCRE